MLKRVLILSLVLCAGAAFAQTQPKAGGTMPDAASAVNAAKVVSAENAITSAGPTMQGTAKVVFYPIREAILASRIDGVVLENNLKLGQRFQVGETLVKLDDTRFQVELDRVKALEKESIALSEFAKTALSNQEDLFKQNLLSELDYKKAKLDVETSAARLLAVKANRREAENQLSYCQIKAPFAGRVEEIATRSFETLRAGQPLMRVIDDSQLKALMFVPVFMLDTIKLGSEIELYCSDTKQKVKGVVAEIAPRADHRSGTIEMRAVIDNSNGAITAGMVGEFYYARPR